MKVTVYFPTTYNRKSLHDFVCSFKQKTNKNQDRKFVFVGYEKHVSQFKEINKDYLSFQKTTNSNFHRKNIEKFQHTFFYSICLCPYSLILSFSLFLGNL